MEGNIHAALLICTLLFTIFLLWRYGKLKVQLYRIVLAPVLGVLIFFVSTFFSCASAEQATIRQFRPGCLLRVVLC
ncbi:MAG: hypothetical protein J7K84_11625 [Deltaproteobacteria bacterium]|nr:hypothetical protein [Deltaproteobacteria bacterium]